MKSLIQFLSYHNAVPIAFGILFLGATGVAAASPEVRDAVFETQTVVRSVDNSRIVSADIDALPFTVEITGVTEDEEQYYVAYTLATIELVDSVWQDVVKQKELAVGKVFLEGRDLGHYASRQIAEVRDAEKKRLKETQVYEQELGQSQKVVATIYSGLVGQFVEPQEEVLPVYVEQQSDTVPSIARTDADTTPPAISLLGNSVERIFLKSVYTDLGVTVTDNYDGDIGYEVFVDGKPVERVDLDTSRVWAYVITYRATDAAGNVAEVRREVVVDGEGSAVPLPAQSEATMDTAPTSESDATASSTPEVSDVEPQSTETSSTTASSTPQ